MLSGYCEDLRFDSEFISIGIGLRNMFTFAMKISLKVINVTKQALYCL